jgi:hypothetical protein
MFIYRNLLGWRERGAHFGRMRGLRWEAFRFGRDRRHLRGGRKNNPVLAYPVIPSEVEGSR